MSNAVDEFADNHGQPFTKIPDIFPEQSHGQFTKQSSNICFEKIKGGPNGSCLGRSRLRMPSPTRPDLTRRVMPIEGHLAGLHSPFFNEPEERQIAIAQSTLLVSVGNANTPPMS